MSSDLTCEVLVVGAGIAGAATAFHLADRGVDTILADREYPASGPTGRSSAITHAFYLEPELSQLGHRGCEQLRNLPETIGHPSDYRACGMMWGCAPEAAAQWTAAVERIQGEGARIETLTSEQLADAAPGFDVSGLAMGIWEPDGGYADPATSTTSFANAACERGARLLVRSPVERLLTRGAHTTGVRLDDGRTVDADRVVLATGPWTKELVRQVGVELPLFIERHPMAVIDARGTAREVMPFSWCDDALANYARPEGENLVLAGTWAGGGTGERHQDAERPRTIDRPEDLNPTVSLEESESIVRQFVPRVARIEHLGIRDGYADLYDMSPDDLPLIGPLPGHEGLYVIAGSSGHGFKMGPAVGEEVARELTGDPSPLLERFRLDRPFPAAVAAASA